MSVINQMLKDLDKRAPESAVGDREYPITVNKKSSLTPILIIVFIIVLLNVVGIYIWQLLAENQQLKDHQVPPIKTLSVEMATKAVKGTTPIKEEQKIESKKVIAKPLPIEVQNKQVLSSTLVTKQKLKTASSPLVQINAVIESQQQKEDESTPLASVNSKIESNLNIKPAVTFPETKMTVSRRQLTSKELVEQKLAQAEEALSINKISRAETLFEDVLIIEPTHLMARKKLAALWFGRKAYGPALNLLSQGLIINPSSNELRMMKARIYSKQGYWPLAYKTLIPLASFEQEEYQIFLANTAQQVKEYKSAANAYQLLIKMQPYVGRWYLGLGIVYDKNSQFLLAIEAYNQALIYGDLSSSSIKFAQQRKQALASGE